MNAERGRLMVVLFSASLLFALSTWAALANDRMLVYIGTYTGTKSQGIYVCRFDRAAGTLTRPELAAKTPNPTFLAIHATTRCLYAVGEVDNFGGKPTGSVSAFRVDTKSGKLALLDQQPSGGAGPCHVAVDPTGKTVLVANYGSGSVAALPLRSDGALEPPASVIQHHGSSVNAQRQSGPHAHFITTDPGNRFAFACDLGLDKVLIYRFDPQKASLTPNDPPSASVPAGAGPRHLVFHPNGEFVYVINEMGSSVCAFAYDARRGSLELLQTLSTLPASANGPSSCAEVQIHPSGKFLYGSNRGHDSIAVFGIDAKTGKLALVGHEPTQGKTPRHFTLTPDGAWLLAENQDSDNVVVFAVDQVTGKLHPTGHSIEVGAPVCAVFLPAD
jgi:6-phosphogluconolactonase